MFQLTNRMLKEFGSLDDAKGRRRSGLFVAEGTKCVGELLRVFHARYLFALPSWLADNKAEADEVVEASPAMLRQLTRLQATPPVIAYFEHPEAGELPALDGLTVALDRVQDPGNMGTILPLPCMKSRKDGASCPSLHPPPILKISPRVY